MTRRATSFLAIAVSTVALGGCATFSNVDRVASVDGTDITRDDYEALLDGIFANEEVLGVPPVESGRGDAGVARTVVTLEVTNSVLADVVGEEELDAVVADLLGEAPPGDPILEMPAELQRLLVAASEAGRATALEAVAAPEADELERLYEERPAAAGVLCIRHILLESETEADEVVAELADGADFGELAAERSVDSGSGASGGAVPSGTGPCWTLGEAIEGLVPEFVTAAIELAPGVPSAPIESDFGWHVIEQLAWDDVAEAVVAAHAEGVTGGVQFNAALVAADIDVDPAIGVWDPAARQVVALG